ncbi:MAG: glycine betaine ABC transporter substrate-binding protein [Arenicella sp.]
MKNIIVALALFLSSLGAHAEVVVGGKGYTEQLLLAEMTRLLLDKNGIEVTKKDGMGTSVLRAAQENGQIDLYWEYTGTSLVTFNKVSEKLTAEETYAKVKELDEKIGLVWLERSLANNTYALAMRAADAKEKGITTMSELAAKFNAGNELTLALNAEFYARPDGWKPVQEKYEFEVERKNVKRMDTGLVYTALKENQVDIGLVFATDGRIPAFDFTVLEDDKGFFPTYNPAPVIRKEALEKEPKLAEILNKMAGVLTSDSLAKLNATVDVDKVSIEEASRSFLKANGLI